MFQRQWFDASAQLGLSEQALEFEDALRSRAFYRSREIMMMALYDAKESDSRSGIDYWTRQGSRLHAILKLYHQPRRCLTVFFSDFWSGFIPEESSILELLRNSLNGYKLVVTERVTLADIVVSSCFGSSRINPNLPILASCLYLGENVRPSFTEYDFCLSFDEEEFCGRNVYTPLWYLRTDIFHCIGRNYEVIPCKVICKPRRLYKRQKPVVMIATNMTPQRLSFLELSRRHGISVECFGSSFRPVDSKIEKMKEYNYAVAFENSYHPGYVTEKVFDAYVSGAIPLYTGSNSSRCPFNLDKVIDMTPYLQAGALPERLVAGSVQDSNDDGDLNTGLVDFSALQGLDLQIRGSIASFFNWLPR